MKGRIFLVEWDAAKAAALAASLRELGWSVESESNDGGEAYRRVRAAPPDAVLIGASTRPGHGIQTALSLRQPRATRDLPLFFVDASEEARARISARVAGARFVESRELPTVLDRIDDAAPDT